MARILFIDNVCSKAYDPTILAKEPLGGTEATVTRVAEGLSGLGHTCVVMQDKRTNSCVSDTGCIYSGMKDSSLDAQWDAIIVLRSPYPLHYIRRRKRDTKLFLWAHDLAGAWLGERLDKVLSTQTKIVSVSEFHKINIVEYCKSLNFTEGLRVTSIHNPIDNTLAPDATPIDKNKLVFFSSPHKGLPIALGMFNSLRRFNPDFKLYISNPGYMPDFDTKDMQNVINLGALSHSQCLEHVRSALCVLYPNFIVPETFGLVFAEANAVGTPVITHSHGAAREVLSDPWQLTDCRSLRSVVDNVMMWHAHRPTITPRTDFKLSNILPKWEALLNA